MGMTEIGAIALANVLSVVALGMKLHWDIRRQTQHGQMLARLVQLLPPGSHLEEENPDGTRLTLSMAQEEKHDG